MKYLITIIIIILAILSIVFGSVLPFHKAQLYIKTVQAVTSFKTLGDFTDNFKKVFNFYSPIGDEEVIKFTSSIILSLINQTNQSEEADLALVEFIEPYIFKNEVRHLLNGAYMYSSLWQKYKKEEYFKKAENYYQRVYAIGPKLPPALYGLLDLYQLAGNQEKIKEIGEIILIHWPNDDKVKALISK